MVAIMLEKIGLMLKIEKQIFKTAKWSAALLPPTSKKRQNRFETNYFFLTTVIREVPAGNVINLCAAASTFRMLVNRVFTNFGTFTYELSESPFLPSNLLIKRNPIISGRENTI